MRFLFLLPVCFWSSFGFTEESELWSLQPVTAIDLPSVSSEWPLTDLDRFVAAEWEKKNLTPVKDASPTVLARRLYFNLVGLPPTMSQLERFAEDGFEKTVDQLLASPHFGEKWARHWLDLARYAETNGRDRNVVFAHAWRYRNWVIDALNADMPYDRFVREQIAGDLLEEGNESGLVATGFLTLGPKAFQERDREKFLMDMVDEQIDVVTRSVLGLTVACSRCHDHKFDPIPQADYYALAGIFLSSETLHGPGPLYYQDHKHDSEVALLEQEGAQLDGTLKKWRGEIYEKTIRAMKLRSAGYKIRRMVTGALREKGLKKPQEDPELLAKHNESEAMYAEAAELMEQRDTLMANPPRKPAYVMAMREMETPEDCQLRERGVYNEKGESIPRGRISIPGMPTLDEIGGDESGRRQFGDWLVDPGNPLTARVIVNRVWHHLFGVGLVRTVDNFGMTGEKPTHPELLDYLADRLVTEYDWSLKKLIRELVLSRTWQLASSGDTGTSSQLDPANQYYWRANLRRLDVEAFRDAVLSVSGELRVDPPEKGSLLEDVFLGNEYGKRELDYSEEIEVFPYRAVYLPIIRNEIPELFKQFDFADANAPVGARNSRTIPSQALYLMNDSFIEAQSRAAAQRLLKSAAHSDTQKIDLAAQWVFGCDFEGELKEKVTKYIRDRKSDSRNNDVVEIWTDFFQVLFSGVSFRYLE